MYLERLKISNFRSIEDIEVEFDALVSVIIGPNAVGKTTILEAIRLAKAVLAPRTQHETQQTMISLGVTSPHLPQRIFPNALTRDPGKPTSIAARFKMAGPEITKLRALIPKIAPILAQQIVGVNFAGPAQAAAFFGTMLGKDTLSKSEINLNEELRRIEAGGRIELNLSIDYHSGIMAGEQPIHQVIFSALEQDLPPKQSLFSYFPADRAMPTGEQAVQLGVADTSQQLESHNSQPQVKYARLKHAIFSTIIAGKAGRPQLDERFSAIFDKILKGRELGEIGINEMGMLSIPIIDTESGDQFNIDALSSGEKGLILTFLLIAEGVSQNGIVLLDEPELHLNPSVCRDLLQFLVDEYAIPNNIQAIVCSHSTEILAGAFDWDQCCLFHLRDGRSLAKVRQQDQGEIRDALRRLGTSESESLLYRGTVLVEGIHDAEILQNGFDHILRRYRVKDRGGRGQIEKDIADLQRAEHKGDEIGRHFFIFDHDRRPTTLSDSDKIKILQLPRYCLENFLLDVDIITDVSRERDFAATPFSTVTQTRDVMRSLALSQLTEVAARAAFKRMGLEAVAFDMSEMQKDNVKDIAQNIDSQIRAIQVLLQKNLETRFAEQFENHIKTELGVLRGTWEDQWREVCNGKRLFEDLRKKGHVHGDLLKLKRRIVAEMRLRRTEAWNALESLLGKLVA